MNDTLRSILAEVAPAWLRSSLMEQPKYADRDDIPMPAPTWKPAVQSPGAEGVRSDDKQVSAETEEPDEKAMSGAAARTPREPFVNPLADRNTEGPRQAGMTPRPTDKPIS